MKLRNHSNRKSGPQATKPRSIRGYELNYESEDVDAENAGAINKVYQIMAYDSTREVCWENPMDFWSKMYSIFHKFTNSEHEGFFEERLVATMDRFSIEIEPYEDQNLKHAMWIYVNWGVVRILKDPLLP